MKVCEVRTCGGFSEKNKPISAAESLAMAVEPDIFLEGSRQNKCSARTGMGGNVDQMVNGRDPTDELFHYLRNALMK